MDSAFAAAGVVEWAASAAAVGSVEWEDSVAVGSVAQNHPVELENLIGLRDWDSAAKHSVPLEDFALDHFVAVDLSARKNPVAQKDLEFEDQVGLKDFAVMDSVAQNRPVWLEDCLASANSVAPADSAAPADPVAAGVAAAEHRVLLEEFVAVNLFAQNDPVARGDSAGQYPGPLEDFAGLGD